MGYVIVNQVIVIQGEKDLMILKHAMCTSMKWNYDSNLV